MYEENFVGRISQLFNESGLSVKDFADKVGISRQTMDFYLNGNRSPSAESLKKISETFSVTVDWLLAIPGAARSQSADIQSIVNVLHLSEAAANNMMKIKDDYCDLREPFSYLLEHEDFFAVLHFYKRFYKILHDYFLSNKYLEEEYSPFDEVKEENGCIIVKPTEAIELYQQRAVNMFRQLCAREQTYFDFEEDQSLDEIDTARKIKEQIKYSDPEGGADEDDD